MSDGYYDTLTPAEVLDCLDNSDCPWPLRERIKELMEPAEGDARLREALDKFVPHAPGLGHDQTKYPGIPWPGACIRCSIERHVALSGEPSKEPNR